MRISAPPKERVSAIKYYSSVDGLCLIPKQIIPIGGIVKKDSFLSRVIKKIFK